MKNQLIVLCFLILFFISIGQVGAQESAVDTLFFRGVITEILEPYFKALVDGDVRSLSRLISDELYRRNRALLEDNPTYPDFLRNLYNGASFEIERAEMPDENTLFVDVMINYADGRHFQSRWKLTKKWIKNAEYDTIGSWKISGRE